MEDSYVHGVKSVETSKLEVSRWKRDRELKGNKYSGRTIEEIKKAIKDAFKYAPRLSDFNITVEVVSYGDVVLRGEVDNLKAKKVATQDAKNTVGVMSVENRLLIKNRLSIIFLRSINPVNLPICG